MTGSKLPAVQRLQFFLSESVWDPERVNDRRLELLRAGPLTAPHGGGVLVIDDSGDRKDGTKTAHVGRQWLGRYGKTDNGVVTVTTVWADERLYYPVHAVPYTPARHFAKGRATRGSGPSCRSARTWPSGRRRRGSRSGRWPPTAPTGTRTGSAAELADAGLPFVMALKPHRGTWAYREQAHTPVDAARALLWGRPDEPGDWQPVTRAFHDGHTETWWAADASLGWWGRTAPGAWSWRPPTRAPCRTRPPGTWSPTCPAPAAPARRKVPGRPLAWPRSCGSTGCATG